MLRAPTFVLLLPLAIVSVAGACDRDSRGRSPLVLTDTLTSPAAPGSGEPNFALGPDGRVYLTWLEPNADSSQVLRFSILGGRQWSPPRTIARGKNLLANWADFPSLLVLPGGRLAAHWLQRSDTSKYAYDVRIAQSADGGETWSEPVIPHRDGTPTEHGFVSLFVGGGDSLAAAWLDGREFSRGESARKDMMLASTTLSHFGAPGAERILDPRVCDCCQTSVAVTKEGPILVYRDRTDEEIRDISVVRLAGGSWTAPRPVHADGWKISACPVNGPAVVAMGDRVAVAWFTGARDTARVLVAFSTDGGVTFGAPVRVDNGNPAGRVDVELASGDGALVSWIERAGGESAEVRVRRATADGTLGESVAVATSSSARTSGFPRMIASGNDLVFAWTAPGSPSRVRVARANLAELR